MNLDINVLTISLNIDYLLVDTMWSKKKGSSDFNSFKAVRRRASEYLTSSSSQALMSLTGSTGTLRAFKKFLA